MARKSCHDDAVQSEADRLSALGYNVSADVPGYPKPDPICHDGTCGIPDITAEKNGHTRIVEIETPESHGKDQGQRDIFSGYAQDRPRTRFDTKIC